MGGNMTQKELDYVEDATTHEENILKILNESIKNLEDEELITFMEEEVEKHTEMKEVLLSLLEDKANE
jgi:hypothetical protein